MPRMSYADQLAHPNWQRKRLEILSLAGFCCERCGDKEKTLHVHHKRYIKARMAWEYDRPDLVALCKPCHTETEEEIAELHAVLAAAPLSAISKITSIIAGIIKVCGGDDPLAYYAGSIANGLDALPGWTIRDMSMLDDALTTGQIALGAALREAADKYHPAGL